MTKINSITLGKDDYIIVQAAEGQVANASKNPDTGAMLVFSEPPISPPDPDPEPGEVVFSCDFTADQFAEWEQDPPTVTNSRGEEVQAFTMGNAKTHGEAQTGPDGQTTSLRMKMGECRRGNPDGCFPAGETVTIARTVELPEGTYRLEAWQVEHDTGAFSLFFSSNSPIGKWASGGQEWQYIGLETFHPGGPLTLKVWYTAPSDPNAQSGVKVTGLKIRKVR